MKTTTKPAGFTDLVREATECERDWRALSARTKLSAVAFLREAMRVANTTPERLAALREAVEERPESFQATQGFLRSAAKWIREATCTRPATELRRLSWLGRMDEVTGELATVGSHPFELFALAVKIAGERHPEAFGEIEDPRAHEARAREIHERRSQLFQRIGMEYRPEDLDIGDVSPDGRARITFKISGGAVPFAPKENAGERLVNWLLDHPEVVGALEER